VTSSTIDETTYEVYDENNDISDSVFVVDGPDGTVYYGDSDAAHYAKIE